ncbi:MAG: hypothetical protein ACTHLZ_13830 [Tepidisphaeraceae bacterium]
MKFSHAFALTIVLGISGSVTLLHADEPTTQPTKTAKKARPARVTGVYAKLDGLTDDEKAQIAAIHKQALEDKRKIDAKEEDDIKALLTEPQRAQLRDLKEEASAKRKTQASEKKSADATTQPTDAPHADGM